MQESKAKYLYSCFFPFGCNLHVGQLVRIDLQLLVDPNCKDTFEFYHGKVILFNL